MNGKGGMNNKDFEHYIYNSIVPLSSNLEDMPGKWILLKVDSGRGCDWWDLLNKCWFGSVNIYPGIPNSTSIAADGHQLLWSIQGCRLEEPSKDFNAMLAKGITMSLGTSTFGLIVYGGVWPDSGVTLENAWSEVGVVPFTKKCLMNKKVCHDVTDKDYPNFDVFQDIQPQNNYSTT